MSDAVWQKLMAKLKKLDGGPHARVGVFGTEATKAAAHEFGTDDGNVPERSFIRSTFRDHLPELRKVTAQVSRGIVLGTMDTKKGLSILGQWGAAECKKTIKEGPHPDWPPLDDAYEAKKWERGKTTVLVDTGQMINAITYKVEGA